MLLKDISLQLKKLKTSSVLHFNAIEIRAELVLGQAFFDKILPAFEKKSHIFILLIISVETANISNVACHMTKK